MTVGPPGGPGDAAARDGPSDEALLAGLVASDPAAGSAFIRRFGGRVYGLALTVLHDPALAEDVAQEAFVRAWRHGSSYDPRRGSVPAWLLRITRNLAIDAVRLRRAEPTDPEVLAALVTLAAPGGPAPVEEAAVVAAMVDSVRRALSELPPEQARALLLAAFAGRTAEEISRSEGVPVGTAKTRIRLGLRRVRMLLGAEEETWA